MNDNKNSVNNYSLLIKDYEYVTTKLIKQLSKEDFILFYDKFTCCMKNQFNKGSKLYSMLLFYNLYKNYRKKFFDMNNYDISLIINTLLFFIDEQDINLLDKSISFVFNESIFNALKSISGDNKILYNMIDIVDSYISYPNYSSCYHALYVIDDLKKEKIYEDDEEKTKKK